MAQDKDKTSCVRLRSIERVCDTLTRALGSGLCGDDEEEVKDNVTTLTEPTTLIERQTGARRLPTLFHTPSRLVFRPAAPDAVIYPESAAHVSEAVKLCVADKIPIIPFGAGSGLEGGVTAPQGGVCFDMSKMDSVIEANPADFDATVEAGVSRKTLNEYLRADGVWFPVDPGADAFVCGMAATQASGTNAVRYGTMRENVLNLQVVLPNGDIVDTAGAGRRPKKSSAGYNMTHVFLGSEGTLGVITRATVKLHGIPEKITSAVVSFDDVHSAVEATVSVLQMGVPVARIEFVNAGMLDAMNKYSHVDFELTPTLLLEFHGSEASTNEQMTIVESLMRDCGANDVGSALSQEQRTKMWDARHKAFWAIVALRPDSKAYSTDVCVPISRLPPIIEESEELLRKYDLDKFAGIVGHVGDGNFHVVLGTQHDADEIQRVGQFHEELCILALEANGTCTGEHGIGLGKRKLLTKEVSPQTLSAMKALKRCFDPHGVMNPGKIFFD